ncbi:MAG TPA: YwiC-like family protein [Kofleriaceae bacterium]
MTRRSLWPREHGAYFQLAIPLLAALVMRTPSGAAIGLAAAACLALLAHEPLLVVLGLRGRRMQRDTGSRARRRAAMLGGGAGLVGVAALAVAPRATLLVAALLLVPVAGVLALAWRRREHTLLGELGAAVALTGASAPVLVASGAAPASALVHWAGWALGFGASVVAVHRVIACHKRSIAPIDVAIAVALIAAAVVCDATAARSLSSMIAAPLVSIAALLAIALPSASRMRAIGIAIAVSAAASGVLVLLAR